MIDYAHVIVDLQAGDTGKGKVAHSLAKSGNYTHIVRYNGGGNAGHTVYHNGVKLVTHFIPVGVLYGTKSIIGPGCVVHPDSLLREIKDLEGKGIEVGKNLLVDYRTHIITDGHVKEDSLDSTIGTTKTGNGPCYRDKYYRKGVRAESIKALEPFLCDVYKEFHSDNMIRILFEGAQGFELDPDWGDYPWVTSSHCTVGSAILNGVPPQKVTKIWGVAKAYRTYVGLKKFENESNEFEKIRELGQEYGATTGRKRQVDWLDLDSLIRAIKINGVTHLVINKLDILEKVKLAINYENHFNEFQTSESFKNFILDEIHSKCQMVESVHFSMTPLTI